jgi:hypothetical protein
MQEPRRFVATGFGVLLEEPTAGVEVVRENFVADWEFPQFEPT